MFEKLFGIGALSAEKFTQFVVKRGIETGRFTAPTVDAEAMTIREGDGAMNLTNVYRSFLGTPRGKRLAFIDSHILAPPPTIPDSWAEMKRNVIPVIRDASYLAHADLMEVGAEERPKIVRRELAPGIYLTMVVDLPHQMVLVQSRMLETANVSADEAFDTALTNLRARSDAPMTEIKPGLWIAPWPEYNAARASLPDVVQRVCTDPLIAIPDRDTLLVADRARPEAVDVLVTLIIDRAQGTQHYPITSRIYQLDHKTLTPFEVPADSYLARPYRRVLVEEMYAAYRRQKEEWEAAGDRDEFYASLMAYESETLGLHTMCVWTADVVSHLPPADRVSFLDRDGGGWIAPWNVVLAAPGCLTRSPSALPRWKTGAFPSADWLAANAEKLSPQT